MGTIKALVILCLSLPVLGCTVPDMERPDRYQQVMIGQEAVCSGEDASGALQPRSASVTLGDGQRVCALIWGRTGSPDHVVIAVHGFPDRAMEFDRFSRWFVGQNEKVLVLAYDQRGFGEQFLHDRRWPGTDTLTEDLIDVIEAVRDTYGPATKLSVLAHSMGAAVAIVALAERTPLDLQISELILAAPAICRRGDLGGALRDILWLGTHVFGGACLPVKENFDIVVDDKELLDEIMRPNSNVKDCATLVQLSRLLDLTENAASNLGRIQVRTLVVQGVSDKVIDARLVSYIAGQASYVADVRGNPHLLQAYFPDRGHLLISEEPKGGTQLFQTIRRFMDSQALPPDTYTELTGALYQAAGDSTSIARCALPR